MKNLFILAYLLLAQVSYASECSSEATCQAPFMYIDIKTNTLKGDLNCTISNMPNVPIKAENVFDSNGNLKTHWNSHSVCDILDWMNEGAAKLSEIEGIATNFTVPITLKFKSQPGSRARSALYSSNNSITFDTDSFVEGNDFAYAMKYMTVHELFHYAQENSIPNIPSTNLWIDEGTAKMFEDFVYDNENPYLVYGNRGLFQGHKIEDILTKITDFGNRYRTFVFWKLMQEKCSPYYSTLIASNTPLSNLNSAAQNCTEISNLSNDKLAGAFVLYTHAMILHNNLRLIAGGEPSSIVDLNKIVKKVNKPNFQDTLDMSAEAGSSMRGHSAKSFLITHETLTSNGDMNLTFKSSGDLKLVAVRVKADGSSDVNDNFVMDSSTQFYKLTKVDREGGLFVTLVNTTGGEVRVDELKITKADFDCDSAFSNGYNIMATYCSYSRNDDGHVWQRDSGFVHIPSSGKESFAADLASEYNWCGTYGSATISSWGGTSYCYEARVYWSKEPVADRNNKSSQKQSAPLYFKVKSYSDNNESY